MGNKLRFLKQSTVIGLLAGGIILFGMILIAPEHMSAFINIPGLIVVFGGTLAATLVCKPLAEVRRVLRNLPDLLNDDKCACDDEVNQLLKVADHYRHGRIRNAEFELSTVTDSFLRTGIQLVLDRSPLEEITKVLNWHIEGTRAQELIEANILRTMATFAPAFGMLGTLFGLVHMLHGLGNNGIAEIGSTMGFAMITTLYGIVAANLFLKPLALKKEQRIQQQVVLMNVLMEGVTQLYARQHPVLIKETLDVLLTHRLNNNHNTNKPRLLKAA